MSTVISADSVRDDGTSEIRLTIGCSRRIIEIQWHRMLNLDMVAIHVARQTPGESDCGGGMLDMTFRAVKDNCTCM